MVSQVLALSSPSWLLAESLDSVDDQFKEPSLRDEWVWQHTDEERFFTAPAERAAKSDSYNLPLIGVRSYGGLFSYTG